MSDAHVPQAAPADGRDAAIRRRPAPRGLYPLTVLAALICSAIVTQVFFAGLGLLVDPSYLSWHTGFVHVIEPAVIVMGVLALLTRGATGLAGLSFVTLLLIATQYALIYAFDGPWRALHAVNALVLFALTWTIARRAASQLTAAARPRVDAGLGLGVTLLAAASILIAGTLPHGNASAQSATATARLEATSRSEAASPADLALGAKVFAQSCSGCHGANGQGSVGPRLAGNDDLSDRGFVERRVREGGGIMPAFGGRLSDDQVASVVAFVRSSWGNEF